MERLKPGIIHSFLGAGGPNQIGGQVFQGFLFTRLDALAGKDVEAGVSPTVEHADELRGDLLLSQEHGEHLDAEELLEGQTGCPPRILNAIC